MSKVILTETKRRGEVDDVLEERIDLISRWAITTSDDYSVVERVEFTGVTIERRSYDGAKSEEIKLSAESLSQLAGLLLANAADVGRLEFDRRPEVEPPAESDDMQGQSFTVVDGALASVDSSGDVQLDKP